MEEKADINNKETRGDQFEACVINSDAAQLARNLGENLIN